MSRLEVRPFKDPLGRTEHKFSEAFEDSERMPEEDFTIVVRRSRHGRLANEMMPRVRAGEMDPAALNAAAKKYESEEDFDPDKATAEEWKEIMETGASQAWMVPLLIEDIPDLPVPDATGKMVRVRLNDHPDEKAETIAWMLEEWPELSPALMKWATEAQQVYDDYLGRAKKDSGSTSTGKRAGRQKKKGNSPPIDAASTSGSERASAAAS